MPIIHASVVQHTITSPPPTSAGYEQFAVYVATASVPIDVRRVRFYAACHMEKDAGGPAYGAVSCSVNDRLIGAAKDPGNFGTFDPIVDVTSAKEYNGQSVSFVTLITNRASKVVGGPTIYIEF